MVGGRVLQADSMRSHIVLVEVIKYKASLKLAQGFYIKFIVFSSMVGIAMILKYSHHCEYNTVAQ